MLHYSVKSARIRSYYGPHFLALGLVSLCIQSICVKIQAGITPKTDYFYAVILKKDNFRKIGGRKMNLSHLMYISLTVEISGKLMLNSFTKIRQYLEVCQLVTKTELS